MATLVGAWCSDPGTLVLFQAPLWFRVGVRTLTFQVFSFCGSMRSQVCSGSALLCPCVFVVFHVCHVMSNIPPLYWYLNSTSLCWITLFMNRCPFIKQYIKSVSCSWKTFLKRLCIWQILHVIHFICDKSIQTPREHHYREQKKSDFTSPLSVPLLTASGYSRL